MARRQRALSRLRDKATEGAKPLARLWWVVGQAGNGPFTGS
ncbi:MAG: hypothetical protein NTW86_15370 [Candidatus Sumerlaeota bacterium]|nr:hypothetical protein [Candidatus Sumerlaeota bacterium]